MKSTQLKYIIPVFCLILIYACSQKNEHQNNASSKVYFDLKHLVQADIDSNNKLQRTEIKSITINGKSETKQLDKVDWQEEMQLLLECDINKTDWQNKFLVQNDSLLHRISYISLSSKIPIKKMILQFDSIQQEKIISIEIEKRIASVLFSNDQKIYYYPFHSFKINSAQKSFWMRDFNSEVEIKY